MSTGSKGGGGVPQGEMPPHGSGVFYKVSSSSNVVLRVFVSAEDLVCVTESGRERQPLLLISTVSRWHLPLPPGTQSTWWYLG